MLLGIGAIVAVVAVVVIAGRPGHRPPSTTLRNVPLSVSCPTTGFCMAVDDEGNAIRFDGTSWSKPMPIEAGGMTAVSCASATFCAAGDLAGSVLVFDGTSWSKPKVVDSGAGGQLDVFGISSITTLSCPSATFCMAADVLGRALRYDGSRWLSPRTIESRSLYTTDLHRASQAIVGVSCPSTSFCGAATVFGRALTWDGSSWSSSKTLVPSSAALTDKSYGFPAITGISCVSSTFCAAVAASGNAYTYDGTTWSHALGIDPESTTEGTGAGLTAVSCASRSFCMAVDGLGRALTYNGTSWSKAELVDPTLGISSLSCPTPSFCVALNDLGNASVYDGTSWSPPQTIDG